MLTKIRAAAALALVVSALWLVGCASVAPSSHQQAVKEVVIDNLRSPWSIAFISAHEALISEKEGALLRVDLRSGERTEIGGFPSDLVSRVHHVMRGDNGGIFDVALSPDFATDRHIFLAYAAENPQGLTTKVIRARLMADRLADVTPILVAEPYTPNEFHHYGGGLVFGADNKLYITIGERLFNEKDQPAFPIAQDVRDRRGKIFRLNPDGSIPADNPDFGPGAVPGLFAIGIRAAQGLTLDQRSGQIWFSEHGTQQGDEINQLTAGANYGWPVETTGRYRDPNYQPPEMPATKFTAPAWAWLQTVAPTGLTFYRGSEFADWDGDLLVAGLSRGSLWRLNFEDGAIVSVEELFVNHRHRARKIAQSPDGSLYLLTDARLTVSPEGRFSFNDQADGALIRIRNAAR